VRLGDVAPRLTFDDLFHLAKIPAVFSGQSDDYPVLPRGGVIAGAHRPDVVVSKDRHAVLHPPRRGFGVTPQSRSALPGHIRHVLSMSAQKQVPRITARRIVSTGAVMADLHAVRDGTIRQLPGYPWRWNKPSTPPTDLDIAVTPARRGGPQPALIGAAALHLCPEALSQRTAGAWVHSSWHRSLPSVSTPPAYSTRRGGTLISLD
jgi:hypothetical protein